MLRSQLQALLANFIIAVTAIFGLHGVYNQRRVPLRLFITAITESEAPDEQIGGQTQLFASRDEPLMQEPGRDAIRYGLTIDKCPDGGVPELLGDAPKMCQTDAECRATYGCTAINGLLHFNQQMHYCCPTRVSLCTQRPRVDLSARLCQVSPTMLKVIYYFDPDPNVMRCVEEHLADCEPNASEFSGFNSLAECRSICRNTACERGEFALMSSGDFDRPQLCQVSTDCPAGYSCREDKLFPGRRMCCGFIIIEPCPAGFHPLMDPFAGHARTCEPLSPIDDACPADNVCVLNQLDQRAYCCAPQHGVCPAGQQPHIHPLTQRSVKCNLHAYYGACPSGYLCTSLLADSSWGFCCSQAIVDNCPPGREPSRNNATGELVTCRVDAHGVCPYDFECVAASGLDGKHGFCCSIPQDAERKEAKNKPSGSTEVPLPDDKVKTNGDTNEAAVVEEGDEIERTMVSRANTDNGLPATSGVTRPSFPVGLDSDETDEESDEEMSEHKRARGAKSKSSDMATASSIMEESSGATKLIIIVTEATPHHLRGRKTAKRRRRNRLKHSRRVKLQRIGENSQGEAPKEQGRLEISVIELKRLLPRRAHSSNTVVGGQKRASKRQKTHLKCPHGYINLTYRRASHCSVNENKAEPQSSDESLCNGIKGSSILCLCILERKPSTCLLCCAPSRKVHPTLGSEDEVVDYGEEKRIGGSSEASDNTKWESHERNENKILSEADDEEMDGNEEDTPSSSSQHHHGHSTSSSFEKNHPKA